MRLLYLIFLLLAPPNLQARWDTATSATISFVTTSRACLSVIHATGQRVSDTCYEKPGAYFIEFGNHGPLSGDLRPMPGDVWEVVIGGHVYSAPLVARPVYLPVIR